MKINRDNYEQYFLDHTEGSLSPEMERELALFLEANVDLKSVLEGFDASPLPSAEIKNDTLKKRLKKNIRPTLHIDETHVDEWLIAESEGQLSDTEITELHAFIKINPPYEFDRKLAGLARFQPDLSITFPRKSYLRKKAAILPITRLSWTISAAAAVVLLIIGIRFFNRPEVIDIPQAGQDAVHPAIAISEPEISAPDKINAVREAGPPTQGLESPGTPALMARTGPFRMEPSLTCALVTHYSQESIVSNMTAYNYSPGEVAEKKDKPLIAKVFGNFVAHARDAVQRNSDLDKIKKVDMNIWSIAEAGVKGFNTVSDRDLELMVRRDEEGRIKSYALVDQDRLLLSRNLDKN